MEGRMVLEPLEKVCRDTLGDEIRGQLCWMVGLVYKQLVAFCVVWGKGGEGGSMCGQVGGEGEMGGMGKGQVNMPEYN